MSSVRKTSVLHFVLVFLAGAYLAFKIGNLIVTAKSPVLIYASLAAFFFFLISLRDPSYTIYVFMFFASMPAFLTEDLILVRGVNLVNYSWVMMVLFILMRRLQLMRIEFTVLDKNVVLMVIMIFISLLGGHLKYGGSVESWLYSFGKPLQFIILYFIIYNHHSTEKEIRAILFVNVFISLVLAFFLLYQHKVGLSTLTVRESVLSVRTGGLWSNPNMLTMLFIFNVLILLALFETTGNKAWKTIYLSAIVGLVLGIVFSYTRKSYFGIIIAVLAYFMLNRKRIKMVFVVFILIIISHILPETVIERAKSVVTVSDHGIVLGSSAIKRIGYIATGMRYLKDNPTQILIGGGSGTYEKDAYRYRTDYSHRRGLDPHNTIMNLVCQMGLLGLTIIGLLYYKIYKLSKILKYRSKDIFARKFATVIQIQMLTYFVYCLGASHILLWDAEPTSICFGSMVGCALVLEKRLDLKSAERIDTNED